ncbi:glycosyltransferase family 4 protein [Mariniflexile sp.]|uniref:glycosyltransferase family 4 protein n=1 Tax=Mariniflexile sp. TaxID=1979402 RepID=UPI0035657305
MNHLKILFVLQSPFTDTLGMSKVHFDLKIAFENMGHRVDVLAFEDLYPKGQSAISKITSPLFTVKIFNRLKDIAKDYDVIDANFDCIPYPKASFHFKGLLVYRSHGLQPLYRKFEKKDPFNTVLTEFAKGKKIKFKTRLGNIYRSLQKKPGDKELYDSIKYADLVHCLNAEEHTFLLHKGISAEKMFVLPNGISDEFILKAGESATNTKANVISFVASWTIRKGITDLNAIVNQVKSAAPIEELKLLGGVEDPQKVASFFQTENRTLLHIIPRYKAMELPQLLNNTKVGMFPSYIEGFGLAIVEQLACGIPVVAYKVPGPKDILSDLDPTLLIAPGDKEKFSEKVIEILNMPDDAYQELSKKCKQRAKDFLMSRIASEFISLYKEKLKDLREV